MVSPQRVGPESGAVLWLTQFVSPLPAAWIEQQLQSFSASEAQRLARIRRPLRREQFVVGHALLRRLLKSLGLIDPKIEVAPNGRPHLAGVHLRGFRQLSLAHSRTTVAALASCEPAGVDVEVHRTLRDPAGVLALLHADPNVIAAEAGTDPSEAALKCWVAAEAGAKARNAGCDPGASRVNRLALWNSCWICVAGTANSPATVVSDPLRETYNSTPLKWMAATGLQGP